MVMRLILRQSSALSRRVCSQINVVETARMKPGNRVIITFPDDSGLEPAVGNVVERRVLAGKGLVIKVHHDEGDEGYDNWYPVKWVNPLLRSVYPPTFKLPTQSATWSDPQ